MLPFLIFAILSLLLGNGSCSKVQAVQDGEDQLPTVIMNYVTPRWLIIRRFTISNSLSTLNDCDEAAPVSALDCSRYTGQTQVACLIAAVRNLESRVAYHNERFDTLVNDLYSDPEPNVFPWYSLLLLCLNALIISALLRCLCTRRRKKSPNKNKTEEKSSPYVQPSQILTDFSPCEQSQAAYNYAPVNPVYFVPVTQPQPPSTMNSGIFFPPSEYPGNA